MAVVDDVFQRNLIAGFLRLTECVGGLHSSSPPISGLQRSVVFGFQSPPVQDDECLQFPGCLPPVGCAPVLLPTTTTTYEQTPVSTPPPSAAVTDHSFSERENDDGGVICMDQDDDDESVQDIECVTPPTIPLEPMFARRRVTLSFTEFKRLQTAPHKCSKCNKTKTKADFAQRRAKNYVLLQQCATCREQSRRKKPKKPIPDIRHASSSSSGRRRASTGQSSKQFPKGRYTEEASDDEDTDSDE